MTDGPSPPVADADELVETAFLAGLKPDPVLTVDQWADEYRVLSRTTSGEPGRWRTDRTPYLREIMEALSPTSTVETVVFMAGAQVGKTEVGNNFLGYVIDQAPAPALIVLPTEGVAQRMSKQRLRPLVRETPALARKVKDPRRRDSGNTLLRYEFPGGSFDLVAAESPAQLRSTPARYLFGDEVDAYPESSGDEGDPCELASRAQITFRRRKRLWTSTPTIAGHSKIEALYLRTDQRVYLVPCPSCGFRQRLVWGQLRFDDTLKGAEFRASVRYVCAECEATIDEGAKEDMLAAGSWEATAEPEDDRSRGYHLSALYSPWFKWAELAAKWRRAHRTPIELQTFVNLMLGETWADRGEAPDWQRLYERRERYREGTVPAGAVFLTAGVDVQGDRFELEVVAWGPNRESWSVTYLVVRGDPAEQSSWDELWKVLDRTYRHESGAELPIRLTAVDSSDQTQTVYSQVKRRARTIAIKGQDSATVVIRPPTHQTSKRKKRVGSPVWIVGTDLVKEELYAALRLPGPVGDDPAPPGYCHFPDAYPERYFRGLCSEERVSKRNARGRLVRTWRQVAERNEPLDCRVYARAAAAEVGLDRWTESRWAQERDAAGLTSSMSARKRPARKRSRTERGGGRFDRWRG